MESPRKRSLRRTPARPAAGRRDPSLEAALEHPIFEPLAPWLARLDRAGGATLASLNALADEAGITTASGWPIRFVPPGTSDRYYELRVFESGCVQTRPQNRHDFFNALAWLAFPAAKAMLNALHAAKMPLETSGRGRFRDLLTIFDEGGAVVRCADSSLVDLLRGFRWKELFWKNRTRVREALRISVFGHAVLEQALQPWPGITCRAIFVPLDADPDVEAAKWLAGLADDATPRALASLPVFGYPGWMAENASGAFYDDERYFRPLKREHGKMPVGVGQAAAVHNTEESPGSEERDAG